MKRVALALLALALVPAATPGSAAAATPLHTYAVGGGFAPSALFEPGTQHFAFSAHQEVGATTPKGHAVFWIVDNEGEKLARLSGPVTCLVTTATPQGGQANITFRIEKSTVPEITEGTHAGFAVVDGGRSDLISQAATFGGSRCLPSGPLVALVTKGNIVVALQSPTVATPLSGSWYSIGSDGSLSILMETGWEVMQ